MADFLSPSFSNSSLKIAISLPWYQEFQSSKGNSEIKKKGGGNLEIECTWSPKDSGFPWPCQSSPFFYWADRSFPRNEPDFRLQKTLPIQPRTDRCGSGRRKKGTRTIPKSKWGRNVESGWAAIRLFFSRFFLPRSLFDTICWEAVLIFPI